MQNANNNSPNHSVLNRPMGCKACRMQITTAQIVSYSAADEVQGI